MYLTLQPVELLPKLISDFKEELIPRRLPIRMVYSLYKEHERERQSELWKYFEEIGNWQKEVYAEITKRETDNRIHFIMHLRTTEYPTNNWFALQDKPW